MTSLPETLILVLYFFVLSILAIYGWHRYNAQDEKVQNEDQCLRQRQIGRAHV